MTSLAETPSSDMTCKHGITEGITTPWSEENEIAELARAAPTVENKMRPWWGSRQNPTRRFRDFCYRTCKSWSCERRVIGKAEYPPGKTNPRFVVNNLTTRQVSAKRLYETPCCARGDMENRIKEPQLGLFADRTSTTTMRTNQLRLYFSSFSYVLMQGLRRLGLADTAHAKAQSTTIRVRLLKIGARIRVY